MASPFLTRRFQTLFLVASGLSFLIYAISWPVPWAKGMARDQVETCYSDDPDGWASGCISIKHDLKEAAETYGTVKSHRILTVTRGFSNRDYTVTLEAEREKGRTTEVVHVLVGYSNSQEQRFSQTESLEIRPR